MGTPCYTYYNRLWICVRYTPYRKSYDALTIAPIRSRIFNAGFYILIHIRTITIF